MTKQQRLKLPGYLSAVGNHVTHCVNCGTAEGLQIAHYSGLYSDRLGNGMGSKSHDYCVARLCRDCHRKLDNYELGNDEKRAKIFLVAIVKTMTEICRTWRDSTPKPRDISEQIE